MEYPNDDECDGKEDTDHIEAFLAEPVRNLANLAIDTVGTSVGELRSVTVEESPHEEDTNTDEEKGVDRDGVCVGNDKAARLEC